MHAHVARQRGTTGANLQPLGTRGGSTRLDEASTVTLATDGASYDPVVGSTAHSPDQTFSLNLGSSHDPTSASGPSRRSKKRTAALVDAASQAESPRKRSKTANQDSRSARTNTKRDAPIGSFCTEQARSAQQSDRLRSHRHTTNTDAPALYISPGQPPTLSSAATSRPAASERQPDSDLEEGEIPESSAPASPLPLPSTSSASPAPSIKPRRKKRSKKRRQKKKKEAPPQPPRPPRIGPDGLTVTQRKKQRRLENATRRQQEDAACQRALDKVDGLEPTAEEDDQRLQAMRTDSPVWVEDSSSASTRFLQAQTTASEPLKLLWDVTAATTGSEGSRHLSNAATVTVRQDERRPLKRVRVTSSDEAALKMDARGAEKGDAPESKHPSPFDLVPRKLLSTSRAFRALARDKAVSNTYPSSEPVLPTQSTMSTSPRRERVGGKRANLGITVDRPAKRAAVEPRKTKVHIPRPLWEYEPIPSTPSPMNPSETRRDTAALWKPIGSKISETVATDCATSSTATADELVPNEALVAQTTSSPLPEHGVLLVSQEALPAAAADIAAVRQDGSIGDFTAPLTELELCASGRFDQEQRPAGAGKASSAPSVSTAPPLNEDGTQKLSSKQRRIIRKQEREERKKQWKREKYREKNKEKWERFVTRVEGDRCDRALAAIEWLKPSAEDQERFQAMMSSPPPWVEDLEWIRAVLGRVAKVCGRSETRFRSGFDD
ncbi:hypothetical protein JCM10908_006644 [Rhodotorula pacifica]|uniref:uncharacterized protein n=1 Tax=Rhodotorula pacifica TaxID=1495444 RepID=UPI003175DB0D